MKKTILLLFLALLASSLFADPFGLKMGMTLDEIQEKCGGKEPKYLGMGVYKIEPIKKYELFASYLAKVHDDLGLYSVLAQTKDLAMEDCKPYIALIGAQLEQYYGNSIKADDIYSWTVERHIVLKKEKLADITLFISSDYGEENEGSVALGYTFENGEEARATAGGPF